MTTMSRLLVSMTALTAALAFAALTQEGEGDATFDAKGTLGLKIHGTAKHVAVKDDGTTTTVTVQMKDVDTDNSLRNKHMNEDMEAEKFPALSIAVPTKSIEIPSNGSKTAKGNFTLHGVTKEVPFEYTADAAGNVKGTANINLADFGVKIRSYLGVTVKPDITVATNFKVKK